MCTYESLLSDADQLGLEVIEKNFHSDAKGFCKGNKIGIKKNMSQSEKACILAEEIGHFQTTVGNIIDLNNLQNRKQEKAARKWAVKKMISTEDLIHAAEHSCNTLYDAAEFLGVTEKFLQDAILIFREIYGVQHTVSDKTVIFLDRGFYVVSKDM